MNRIIPIIVIVSLFSIIIGCDGDCGISTNTVCTAYIHQIATTTPAAAKLHHKQHLQKPSFVIGVSRHNQQQQQQQQQQKQFVPYSSSTSWLGAGFGSSSTATGSGGGNSSSGKGDKKDIKLKPKQQWDRYLIDLKKMDKIRVAVRVVKDTSDSSKDWIEVGTIKSFDNAYTAQAVARQRALIADHARRLFPMKVSTKDKLEWGYSIVTKQIANEEKEVMAEATVDVDNDTQQWVVVDTKSIDNSYPPDIEKKIGFEGTADPNTGYYCVYNEGRIVNMVDAGYDSKLGASNSKSKRLK